MGTTNASQRSWDGLFYHFAFIEKMNSGESCISHQFLTIFLSSDEMLMFSLGLCCTFFVLKIMISTQISSGMVSGCWPKSRRPTLETENPWFCSCEMQSENITNRERWFVGDFYDCLLWFDLVHFGIYWYSQVKYRRGSVWRVLQAEGVFGEKIAVGSKWNILINNKGFFTSITPNNKDIHLGKRDSNVEGDLVVEHHNLSFKVCIFCFFIGTKYW